MIKSVLYSETKYRDKWPCKLCLVTLILGQKVQYLLSVTIFSFLSFETFLFTALRQAQDYREHGGAFGLVSDGGWSLQQPCRGHNRTLPVFTSAIPRHARACHAAKTADQGIFFFFFLKHEL